MEYRNEKGQLHRLDGPAVIWADGTKEWWVNGLRHRLDGPAYIGPDGFQAWFQNNKKHRLDGPAIISPDGREKWLINDKQIPREEVLLWIEQLSLSSWQKWTQHEKCLFRMSFLNGI